MTRRLRDIVLLLGAILDAPFAQPHSWTSELVRRNAKRGESPSRRIPCPNCTRPDEVNGRGYTVDKYNHGQPCERCGAVIEQEQPLVFRAGRGWIEVDDYTEKQVGSVRTEVILEIKTVACDVCGGSGSTLAERWRGENNRCLRCNGGGKIEMLASQWRAARSTWRSEPGPDESSGSMVLDTMDARARSGSFDECAEAMEEMRRRWPSIFRLVCDTYIRLDVVTAAERHAAEAIGLEFLSIWMPNEIKVPGWVRQRAREREAA